MEVDIKRRICNLPDIPFFAIKSMQAIEVKFESNRDTVDDSTGVMAGYATYKEGTVTTTTTTTTTIYLFINNIAFNSSLPRK